MVFHIFENNDLFMRDKKCHSSKDVPPLKVEAEQQVVDLVSRRPQTDPREVLRSQSSV